jgi:adenylate cyclase
VGYTVNLASRLESHGEAGRILVSEASFLILRDSYRFSDPYTLELKGKGPTSVRFLLGGA